MTQDQFNRAGLILEQISKTKQLRKELFDAYGKHKEDKELKSLLNKCVDVVDVLIEIDEQKFKQL